MTSEESASNGHHGPSASTSSLLPPEIWSQVLHQLDADDLQHTALALSRALPLSGVTLKHLFTHLRITRDREQANQLIRRLGPRFKDADFVATLVNTFANRAWRSVVRTCTRGGGMIADMAAYNPERTRSCLSISAIAFRIYASSTCI